MSFAGQQNANPSGIAGLGQDPSTLAATGLLAAELFAVVAGFINLFGEAPDLQTRLLALTTSVDVGDVAVLGVAVALLVVTPDPPGGIPRKILLQWSVILGVLITVFAVVRAFVDVGLDGATVFRLQSFIATIGVAIAAATVSFYAARAVLPEEEVVTATE
jgi:hypothetical protein